MPGTVLWHGDIRLFVTPWTVAHQAPLSMNSPGKNTRMNCHSLFQEIFPTQWSNPCLLHCRQILYCLSHQGSPRTLVMLWEVINIITRFILLASLWKNSEDPSNETHWPESKLGTSGWSEDPREMGMQKAEDERPGERDFWRGFTGEFLHTVHCPKCCTQIIPF